jgi:hypothetical protein
MNGLTNNADTIRHPLSNTISTSNGSQDVDTIAKLEILIGLLFLNKIKNI